MKGKLLLQITLPLILLSSIFVQSVRASDWSDISNHWAKSAIVWATEKEVAQGYQDGTFKPNQKVTESEFLALLIRFFPNSKTQLNEMENNVPNHRHWADNYYGVAKIYNIPVTGGSKVDKRNAPVSRGQVAQMIAGAFGMNYDVEGAIAFLYDAGLSKGKGSKPTISGFGANAPLTRAEAVQFLKTIADTNNSLVMNQRPQYQQTNPNVAKYKGGTTQPKPPAAQPPTNTGIPTLEQIKLLAETNGFRIPDIFDTSQGFLVYKDFNEAFNVLLTLKNGSITQFSVDIRASKTDSNFIFVQQIMKLYGLPSSSVAIDLSDSMKKGTITKKYGSYNVRIWRQGAKMTISLTK